MLMNPFLKFWAFRIKKASSSCSDFFISRSTFCPYSWSALMIFMASMFSRNFSSCSFFSCFPFSTNYSRVRVFLRVSRSISVFLLLSAFCDYFMDLVSRWRFWMMSINRSSCFMFELSFLLSASKIFLTLCCFFCSLFLSRAFIFFSWFFSAYSISFRESLI